MRQLSVILLLVLLAGCSQAPNEELQLQISQLANSDIIWEGTTFGLYPAIMDKAAQNILKQGERAAPGLREALSDTNKFAAAHVLLTIIGKKEFPASAEHWNGLRVDLEADGTVKLHPEQMDEIKKMWPGN